jgi:hypothetical protein
MTTRSKSKGVCVLAATKRHELFTSVDELTQTDQSINRSKARNILSISSYSHAGRETGGTSRPIMVNNCEPIIDFVGALFKYCI